MQCHSQSCDPIDIIVSNFNARFIFRYLSTIHGHNGFLSAGSNRYVDLAPICDCYLQLCTCEEPVGRLSVSRIIISAARRSATKFLIVADKHLLARNACFRKRKREVENTPSWADKGLAGEVLLITGLLTNEHEPG